MSEVGGTPRRGWRDAHTLAAGESIRPTSAHRQLNQPDIAYARRLALP